MKHFVEALTELFAAFPATTVLITYGNISKSKTKKQLDDGPQNFVKFKCFEPALGKCLSYTAYKARELTALLAHLGPRGLPKTEVQETEQEPLSKRRRVEVGLSGIMANNKSEETKDEEEVREKEPPKQAKGKKGKKKGKRK